MIRLPSRYGSREKQVHPTAEGPLALSSCPRPTSCDPQAALLMELTSVDENSQNDSLDLCDRAVRGCHFRSVTCRDDDRKVGGKGCRDLIRESASARVSAAP